MRFVYFLGKKMYYVLTWKINLFFRPLMDSLHFKRIHPFMRGNIREGLINIGINIKYHPHSLGREKQQSICRFMPIAGERRVYETSLTRFRIYLILIK